MPTQVGRSHGGLLVASFAAAATGCFRCDKKLAWFGRRVPRGGDVQHAVQGRSVRSAHLQGVDSAAARAVPLLDKPGPATGPYFPLKTFMLHNGRMG